MKMGIYVITELFRDTLVGIPISPELMKCTPIPYKWKEYSNHKGSSWIFQSILAGGIIPGGQENGRSRQAVFLNTTESFWKRTRKRRKPHYDHTVLQKVPDETRWKRNQNAV